MDGDLSELATVDKVRQWAGLRENTWQSVSTRLGTVPNPARAGVHPGRIAARRVGAEKSPTALLHTYAS